jgi:hypothetical protein
MTLIIGFATGGEEFVGIGEGRILVSAVFRNGRGKERSTYLHLCAPVCTELFSHPRTISSRISSHIIPGMRAIVSLASS